jgi:Mg2+/Co2+ transporter CorB
LDVEGLNEKFELCLPTNDAYETLGGLMLHHAEEIPNQGFKLALEGCLMTVEEVSSSKIQTILIETIERGTP